MRTLIGHGEDDDYGHDEPPEPSGSGDEEPAEPLRPDQEVLIIDGSFSGFNGIVQDVDEQRRRVRVQVNFFGRSTPVEFDFAHVRRLE
jgi:transcription termination/antitermination protein NusG